MNFKSIDEILGFAIEKEKEAVAFYTDLSKKQTTDALLLTFRELAQEEAKHVKLLTNISKNQNVIKSYELKKVPDLKISDYLVEMEYSEGMIMQDILVLAMKREEMAVKLYTQLAMGSADDESIKLFKLLAQEESKHKLTFEKLYDDGLAGQGH
ncbi:MAG: ferritin family protein [Proteobacteria bacterium]|nr:ferritin family protein [Pseudomonadota bacterium]